MRTTAVTCAGLLLGSWGCLSTPGAAVGDGGDGPVDGPVDSGVDAGPCRDVDGDGWPTGDCAGLRFDDCDDGDNSRHPGARESCDTGADLDCDDATLACADEIDDLETTVIDTTDRQIDGGNLRARLTEADGYVMSYLRVGTSGDLLYSGEMLERYAGVHNWTHVHSVLPDTATLTEVVSGPAVTQFAVVWADSDPDEDYALSGTTTLTFHADGRIHRREAFGHDGVDGDSNYLVGYLALDQDDFSNYSYQSGGSTPVDQSTGDVSLGLWTCAYREENVEDEEEGYEVGWMATVPSGMPAAAARILSSDEVSQFVFQLDFARPAGAALAPGPYVGNFVVRPTTYTGDDVCEQAEATGLAFASPIGLSTSGEAEVITDAPADDDDDDDGFGDGFVDGAGWWTIDANGPGVRFRVVASLGDAPPPSSTFRISEIAFSPTPVVTLDDVRLVHGRDYLLQDDPQTELTAPEPGVLLLLTVPLEDDDEIEVIAAPGVTTAGG